MCKRQYFKLDRRTDSQRALDAHIQNDTGHAIDTASVLRGARFCLSVITASRQFNDAMMYLNADRAGGQDLVTLDLRENFLLNLCVIFHCESLLIA